MAYLLDSEKQNSFEKSYSHYNLCICVLNDWENNFYKKSRCRIEILIILKYKLETPRF